jgi:nicotinate phosphoribosyltransferase
MNIPFLKAKQPEPVVQSLLDTDLYKFTMMQTILHRFPAVPAEYTFKCRNVPDGKPLTSFIDEINRELDALCNLRFTEAELEYLRGLRFIKSDFVDFLALFRLVRGFIQVRPSAKAGEIEILARGPMIHVMLFEIYVLSIVNELYFRQFPEQESLEKGALRLADKIAAVQRAEPDLAKVINPFQVFDFGTRRRFSRRWHEIVVRTLQKELPEYLRGTSNVDLARRLGLTPIGTMAHEYLQAHQALGYRLKDFQKAALENWVQEYRGDLGIALTDTVGMDAFLADFDLYFAKLFDGLRHDSGDPVAWGEKALAHYAKLKVDPRTKSLVFSDGLTLPKAIDLHLHFGNRARTAFGIGTNLTNDCGPTPLNIVMKLTRCDGQPVAKISDSPGKLMCEDAAFIQYLASVFGVEKGV